MTATLAEKAETARAAERKRREKDAAKRRREMISTYKPLAAKRMGEVVGRRVAQNRIDVTGTGSDRSGATIIFTYDGVEFEYGNYDGLAVRKPCPECGETISKHVSYGDSGLPSIGAFLRQTVFQSYEHACFKTALTSLRREAEQYASKLKTSAYELLVSAAEGH